MNGSKPISPKTHGIMDYLIGLLLLVAPNLLGFADNGAASLAARLVGTIILAQALITDFDLGVLKILPFRTHLALDYLVGPFLALTPLLFGFIDDSMNAWLPHILVGLMILLQAMFTQPHAREVMRR